MHPLKTVLLLLSFLPIIGCATQTEKRTDIQALVTKGVPVVYVHPLSLDPYTYASVGIAPFHVPENLNNDYGVRVAGLFRDVFLGKGVFNRVQLLDRGFGTNDEALAAGKKAGVDTVLAGEIHYALEGTELGGARLEMAIRLLNVTSGRTVWYIGENMDQPMDYPDLGFVRRALDSLAPPPVKPSNGSQALPTMMAQIAVDMADVMSGALYVKR